MTDFKNLPVYREKEKIIQGLKDNNVIVVESPTGSGKTTQLPIILNEAGYTDKGIIGVTQPRRIASLSVCEFIAKQLNSKISGFVGYKMRFEDRTSLETRIKIMTDGTLLQEIKSDPYLNNYSVIMVDEAHERSLNIDFILGLLKNALKVRNDLKVIISSATIKAEIFSDYFDKSPIISIDSPMYPVQVIYDPPAVANDEESLIQKITDIVERVVSENRKGDILIFLSGERIIKGTVSRLYASTARRKLHIQPLYGRLGKEEQEKVFDPAPLGKIKVVVSTNIAETSITIEGITSVIDSGLCKLNYYSPKTYTSSLIETGISKASANQRKGRAGRTQPGTCYRTYSISSFKERDDFTKEEIFRTDLTEVVLRMAEIGIRDFFSFDFISPPNPNGIVSAIEILHLLDALDKDNKLTAVGKMMVEFPLLPRHSRMIIEAIRVYPSVIRETLIAAAFLSTNTPFLLPQGEEMEARKAHHHFQDPKGDFVAYLKLFREFTKSTDQTKFCDRYYLDEKIVNEIVNIVEQLEEIVSGLGVPITSGGSAKDYLSACARGLIQFVCKRSGRGVYSSATAQKIIIHPGSVMFRESPPYIVAGEIVRISKTFARSVSPLEKEWLQDIHPDLGFVLKDEKGKGKKSDKSKRDTTNNFVLDGRSFPVKLNKKRKKTVQSEWNTLKEIVQSWGNDNWPHFKGLRGNLYFKREMIVQDCKVNTIFKIVSSLNPHKDIISGYPKKTYNISNRAHLQSLSDDLSLILKISRGGKRKHKSIGFISIQTDGQGRYWFKNARSFNMALSDSLDTLERLADELSGELSSREWKNLNQTYRRLDEIYAL